MSQIHILDKYNFEVKDTLSNKQDNKVVLEDTHTRNIETHNETYDFVVDYRASEQLENRDRVLIPDEVKGQYREFIINKIETDTYEGETEVFTEASYLEDLQKAKPIAPQTLDQTTPKSAVEFALTGTGWELGEVEYTGFRTISWTSYNNPYEILKILQTRFESQLDFTIETRGNKVTKRLVHLRQPKELFNGKEIRRGKDLTDLVRTTTSTDVVTALVALAPEPQEDEDGNTPERLVIEIKDDEAQAKWGKAYNYIWGLYEPESSDEDMTEARLRTLATTELNKHNKPKVEYSIEAVSIEEEYPHEKVVLGDKIRLKDDVSEPFFYVDATVKEVTRSIFDKHSKEFVLGEITEHDRLDLRRYFTDLLGKLQQRLRDTNSNLDNIVTIIDQEVERRIYKQDTPPKNPINGQLWLDTSNPDKPILKEYFNGEWLERISAVKDPEDIGAISREQAMFETILSSFNNLKVVHEQLLIESNLIKENKYINQSHIDDIDNKLQAVISSYNQLSEEINKHSDSSRVTLEEANYINQLMMDYSSSVYALRESITVATEFATAHLEYLQSKYTDEKYNEALDQVAETFGLINEDGVLIGDAVLMKDLQDTRDELQQQLTDSTNTLNDMIDSITGDNRNFIIGTSLIDDSQFDIHGGSVMPDRETIEYVHFDSSGISDNLPNIKFHNTNTYNAGVTYTLALDFRSDTVDELDYICLCTPTEHNIMHTDMQPQPFDLIADGQWHRHYMQFTPDKDLVNAYVRIGTDFSNSTDGEFDIRKIHIYKGTSELSWQPAPEDNRQFITQLSREITDLEHKISTKMTQDDFDLLEGQIESVSTEVTQTAEAITNKADKSVVDTINNTVSNHDATLTVHGEGIDTLINKTETHDDSITKVTNKANETAEGLEQTITKVTETEGAIEQAQADIKTNTKEISSKLSSAQYNTDQEGIVASLDAANSERVQLAEEIRDKVTLTDYESHKLNTGTLGSATATHYISADNKGKWLRLAMNEGDRASARFIIADRTSSQHGTAEFNASVFYNNANNAEFIVNSFARMSSFPFTKARFLTKATYDEQYLDVYFDPNREDTNSVAIWLKDNIQQSGWVLQELPVSEIPDGYKATEYEINEKASTKGVLTQHETSITQNGKDISLKASQTELDSVNKTLSEKQAELSIDAETIKGEVKGVSDRLSEVSTTVTQNKDSFDVSVRENNTKFTQIDEDMTTKVGKNEVVTSINASTEGVRIKGDLVDITAGSEINLAIEGAKEYAQDIASSAEKSAKEYALEELDKASEDLVQKNKIITEINLDESGAQIKGDRIELTAGSAIKLAIDSTVEHADAEILEAKKYADKVSKEAKDAAEAYAEKQAKVEREIAEAYADGKVTAEEEARIAEAKAKLAEAKSHANTQAAEAEKAATKVANSKVAPSEVIPSINLDKTGAKIQGDKVDISAGSAIKLAIDAAESNAKGHTQESIDNLQIGGANLIPKTDFDEYINPPNGWTTWGVGAKLNNRIQSNKYLLIQNDTLTGSLGMISDYLVADVIEGQTYTLSYLAATGARINSNMNYNFFIDGGSNQGFPTPEREYVGTVFNVSMYRYTTTVVANFSGRASILIGSRTESEGEYGFIYLAEPQLEVGNKATAWGRAHKDSVSKEKIISEINLDKSGTKISGDMVDIDANRINFKANEAFNLVVGDAEKAIKDAKNAQSTANAAVPKSGVVSAINASRESMKISANKLALIGGKSISLRLNDADKAAASAQSTANTANRKANDVGDELEGLDVSGTNMLHHTNFKDVRNINKMGDAWGTGASYSRSGEYILISTSSSGTQLGMRTVEDELLFEPNVDYTLSFKAYSSGYTTSDFNYVYIYREDGSNEGSLPTTRTKIGEAPNGYKLYQYTVTFQSRRDHDKPAQMLIADHTTRTGISTWVRIKDVMLQKGNMATPYQLHPSEIVEKSYIIPEINLNAQGAKIQGDKIKLVAGDEISLEIADTQKKVIGANVVNRNLIQNGDLWNSTKRFFDTHTSSATDIFGTVTNPPIGKGWIRMQRENGSLSYMWTHNSGRNRFSVQAGKTYTFSVLVTQNYMSNDLNYVYLRRVSDSRQVRVNNYQVSKTRIGDQWGRYVYKYVFTFEVPFTSNNDTVMFMGFNNSSENRLGYYLSEWKLEEGTEATAHQDEYATKEDLISQINLDDSGVSIQGNKIDITGDEINIGKSSSLKLSTAVDRAQTQADSARNGNNVISSINNDGTTRKMSGARINLYGDAHFNSAMGSSRGITAISGGRIETKRMVANQVDVVRDDAYTSGGKQYGIYMDNGKPNSSYDLTRNTWLQGSEAVQWHKQGYMFDGSHMTKNEMYSVETIYTTHHARYLTIGIGYNLSGDSSSVYALGQIYSFGGGNHGSSTTRTMIYRGDTTWETITIDLGVPDFTTRLAFYLRFGQQTLHHSNRMKVRVNRVHMHG